MRAKEAAFQLGFGKGAVVVRIPLGSLHAVKRIYMCKDGRMTIVLGKRVGE